MIKNTKKTKAKAPAQVGVTKPVAQPSVAAQSQPIVAVVPATKTPTPTPAPKVRLEFSKPGAQSVAIAGTFNAWQPEPATVQGSASGYWVKELSVGPGRYEYLFVVDGQWIPDPNAREQVSNPFGGQNSVLVV